MCKRLVDLGYELNMNETCLQHDAMRLTLPDGGHVSVTIEEAERLSRGGPRSSIG